MSITTTESVVVPPAMAAEQAYQLLMEHGRKLVAIAAEADAVIGAESEHLKKAFTALVDAVKRGKTAVALVEQWKDEERMIFVPALQTLPTGSVRINWTEKRMTKNDVDRLKHTAELSAVLGVDATEVYMAAGTTNSARDGITINVLKDAAKSVKGATNAKGELLTGRALASKMRQTAKDAVQGTNDGTRRVSDALKALGKVLPSDVTPETYQELLRAVKGLNPAD